MLYTIVSWFGLLYPKYTFPFKNSWAQIKKSDISHPLTHKDMILISSFYSTTSPVFPAAFFFRPRPVGSFLKNAIFSAPLASSGRIVWNTSSRLSILNVSVGRRSSLPCTASLRVWYFKDNCLRNVLLCWGVNKIYNMLYYVRVL